jgi:DNA helicase-2/ATP-dependent DNA helicase PcrA
MTLTAADGAIRLCIDQKDSFLLDAGAGSGKTSSLVEGLRYLVHTQKGIECARNSQKIACITFTNVAKDQVIERTSGNKLIYVSTIHDFLWSIVKPYQKELKAALLQHNQTLKDDSSRKRDQNELDSALKNVDVSYSDRGPEFLEGRIFHDDLLDVTRRVFEENSLISRIVAAGYPYIFVDEYQDTSASVIDILVGHVLKANSGSVVIGFFGDKFQSIYHSAGHPGIGEIPDEYAKLLTRIVKGENYRCSKAVIALLNRIRTDIKQYAATTNVEGSAVYIRIVGNNEGDDVLARARAFVSRDLRWNVDEGTCKELFLTHKLIARKAGYEGLLDAYQNRGAFYRDELLNGEDKLITFCRTRIEPLIAAWRAGQIGNVISMLLASGFKLNVTNGKAQAERALQELAEMQSHTNLGDLLAHVNDANLLPLPDDLRKWTRLRQNGDIAAIINNDEGKDAERAFYEEVLETPYAQVSACCQFLEEHTPFSTKHGVKGAEFDTVFVVLDDKAAKWNQYSFDKYLSGEDEVNGKVDRWKRTRNLFYVCCSRAKRNLAVLDFGGRDDAKEKRIKELFGTENCFVLE